MSALENPGEVERLAIRLRAWREDLTGLDRRLRAAGWEDYQLEDLESAGTQLRQVQDLLIRHARRWRRYPLGGDE